MGECATISCVAGAIYFEGYVFMFSTLMAASLLLVRAFVKLPDATSSQRRLRALLILSST